MSLVRGLRLAPRATFFSGGRLLGLRGREHLYGVSCVRMFSLGPFQWGSKYKYQAGVSHQTLSIKETFANRALSDAAAQADFYRCLLAGNHPDIVISRFETSGIARNPECEALYVAALRSMGNNAKADLFLSNAQSSSGAVDRPSFQTPLVSGTPSTMTSFAGKGAPGDPIHVVVAESTLSVVLKWLKWLIPMGLAVWTVLIGFTIISESTSFLKGAGAGGADLTGSGGKSLDATKGQKPNVKFSDVHGVDEARAELVEIVEFLKDPAKFTGLGGRLPRGILLTGPPGTGKTLLARAVAGEAGVPFFIMSGSEFDELYVGVGAKRVRELFAAARSKAPAIVFIDEIDAIGSRRNPRDHAYSKQTLNQLLVDLDGFSQSTGVIFIAATNFPEMLDKALTRPGRFDKIVHVGLPDVRGRVSILQHHMKKIEVGKDIDLSVIARGTPGFSGADLANLVNQAAILASRNRELAVRMNHVEWAKDKIILGAERKTMVLTEESRRNTAFHEAGHAIMALYTPGATNLYKATILPRGNALGVTSQIEDMDKYDQTKRELLARLDVCMGGQMAEELINGSDDVTSGCASDLQAATRVARAMVTSFGMSKQIGPVQLSDNWTDWSSTTREMAEREIRALLMDSQSRTRKLLKEKQVELTRLAHGLLEYETLTKDEIVKIIKDVKLERRKHISNPVIPSPKNKSDNPAINLPGVAVRG